MPATRAGRRLRAAILARMRYHGVAVRRMPPADLQEKVRPGHTALVVLDVLNDFCAEGGMMDGEGADLTAVQAAAGRIPRLLAAARAAGVLAVFVRNEYTSEANSYLSDVWLEQAVRRRGASYTERDVCAAGSWNQDFYGAVRPLPAEPVVTKHRYDAFLNTDLDLILRANRVDTVVLCGVATNVCVETTARAAFVRDYYVVVAEDGTATYSQAEHDAALATLDRYFGEVVAIDVLAAAWGAA